MISYQVDNRTSSNGKLSYGFSRFPARSAIQAKAKPSLRTGAGGVGGLVAVSIGGSFYFPGYDNNGNVIGYWDEDGSIVAEYAYDAFGNTIASSGSMAAVFPHRFSTKYYDAETDLYYYGYRYYSPSLGRWISRDPIEEYNFDNLYLSMGNSTIFEIDPLGLFSHSNCKDDFKSLVRQAESEAKRRLALWISHLNDVGVDSSDSPVLTMRTGDDYGKKYIEINTFYRGLRIKLETIRKSIESSHYGIECECDCSWNPGADAYVRTSWFWRPFDDDIHFCPDFISRADKEEITYTLVHELSHYYLSTTDDNTWNLNQFSLPGKKALETAQFYELLAMKGLSSKSIRNCISEMWENNRNNHSK